MPDGSTRRRHRHGTGSTPELGLRHGAVRDIIVEQNIHVLDVANWFLQAHPLKAYGTGGRKARTDVGIAGHFVVTYWYPDDVLIDFSSAQFTEGFDDLCARVYGTLGTVDSHYGGPVVIRGKKEGWRGGLTTSIYQQGP